MIYLRFVLQALMERGKMNSEKKKKKVGKTAQKAVKKDTGKNDENNSKSDELDFGGLPDRDLRKNLGCG